MCSPQAQNTLSSPVTVPTSCTSLPTHRLSPENHKCHQSTSSQEHSSHPTVNILVTSSTPEPENASYCKLRPQNTNYSLLETDKQKNDCTQLPNVGCQASNKFLSWLLLHITQFQIIIPDIRYSTQQEDPNTWLDRWWVHLTVETEHLMGLTWTDIEWSTTSDTEIHSSCKSMNPHLSNFKSHKSIRFTTLIKSHQILSSAGFKMFRKLPGQSFV